MCNYGQCLAFAHQACDGIIHCNDKSDKSNCTSNALSVTNSTTEGPVDCIDVNDMFLCDNNKCIPLAQNCDGKDDCGDNSDENRTCNHQGKYLRRRFISRSSLIFNI